MGDLEIPPSPSAQVLLTKLYVFIRKYTYLFLLFCFFWGGGISSPKFSPGLNFPLHLRTPDLCLYTVAGSGHYLSFGQFHDKRKVQLSFQSAQTRASAPPPPVPIAEGIRARLRIFGAILGSHHAKKKKTTKENKLRPGVAMA